MKVSLDSGWIPIPAEPEQRPPPPKSYYYVYGAEIFLPGFQIFLPITPSSVFFHYLLRVLGFLIFVAGAALFLKLLSAHGYLPAQAALLPAPAQYKPPPPPPSVDISTFLPSHHSCHDQ